MSADDTVIICSFPHSVGNTKVREYYVNRVNDAESIMDTSITCKDKLSLYFNLGSKKTLSLSIAFEVAKEMEKWHGCPSEYGICIFEYANPFSFYVKR